MIQIWFDIVDNKIQPEDCILEMGYNKPVMGWMLISSFILEDENVRDWFDKQ